MDQYTFVKAKLTEMGIPYRIIEHSAVMTIEEADRYIEGEEGVKTKSLFLCNRKNKAYYLVVLDGSKAVDMKLLEELIPTKGLHFCSEEKLMQKLGLPVGTVSIFGLLNNEDHDVNIILDRGMLEERYIAFHPNVNTATAFIEMADMFRFFEKTGYEYRILDLWKEKVFSG